MGRVLGLDRIAQEDSREAVGPVELAVGEPSKVCPLVGRRDSPLEVRRHHAETIFCMFYLTIWAGETFTCPRKTPPSSSPRRTPGDSNLSGPAVAEVGVTVIGHRVLQRQLAARVLAPLHASEERPTAFLRDSLSHTSKTTSPSPGHELGWPVGRLFAY